jgi:DNA replication protein
MKSSKLIELFKTRNIVIPLYLFKNYKDFALELDEFVFLMYLYNLGNDIVFDIEKFSIELGINSKDILNYISNLTDKKLVEIKTVKSDKINIEKISLDGFYSKIGLLVMDNINNTDDTDNSSVYEMIEKEFGRTLSPMEYEIIKEWLNNNISEELIKEALKEAVFNGVSNLRYIDKILYEWGKLGIKNKKDVKKNRKKHNEKKSDNKDNVDIDIDWNWFDDDTED